jgi:hydroxymethylpyrimidine pyrophosphatase-like HAD family hydrolase
MMKECGVSIAMINGNPHTKELADIITKKDNNHNGVIHALKEFFKTR